jgi:hypothetical protein
MCKPYKKPVATRYVWALLANRREITHRFWWLQAPEAGLTARLQFDFETAGRQNLLFTPAMQLNAHH